MRASVTSTEIRFAAGIVQAVDVTGRELLLRIDNQTVSFYLAHECDIRLHGERVKLRLVQPLDHAQVDFIEDGEVLIAQRVAIDGWPADRLILPEN